MKISPVQCSNLLNYALLYFFAIKNRRLHATAVLRLIRGEKDKSSL
nr:MAG TPA: hypothetical protein [Caudoviricetes sp.]